ncbi:hypothetical protein AVEN_204474-1, partial [Araneus ventricosus]
KKQLLSTISLGCGGLVVRIRIAGSKLDSTEDPPCMGPVARKIIRSGQMPSRWCGAEKFGEGVPAQASSSSSDRGSK